MSIVTTLSSAAILADPKVLFREFQEGNTVLVPDLGYTFAPTAALDAIYELIAEETAEAEDMAALRTNVTGVDYTVFVSPKGRARHAACIKIAVDPPHSLDPTAKNASMAIHDYSTIGAYLPPQIVEQAKQFIERNRDVLLRYWNHEIDTDELIKQLSRP
jgi:hypothetical protein